MRNVVCIYRSAKFRHVGFTYNKHTAHSKATEGCVISSYPLSFEMFLTNATITNYSFVRIYTSTNQSKSPGSDLDNMHIPYLYHLFILKTQIISTV